MSQNPVDDLSDKQKRIYEGLNQIAPGIATFYLGGVKIYQDASFPARAHFLIHAFREIDSGLREALTRTLRTEENRHIKEICQILGVGENDDLALRWRELSKNYGGKAHRSGIEVRPEEFFDQGWLEWEAILHELIGNFSKLYTRIDQMVQVNIPSGEQISALAYILQNEYLEQYFYSKLEKVGWFEPLRSNGYIHGPLAGQPWSQGMFLEKIAEERPDEVLELILDCDPSKDPRIAYFVLMVAARLPLEHTREIIPYLPAWLATANEEQTMSLIIPLETLFDKFLEQNKEDETFDLLAPLLEVRVDPPVQSEIEGPFSPLPTLHSPFWKEAYRFFLESRFTKLLDLNAFRTFTFFVEKLPLLDEVMHWRPAIENHEQNHETGEIPDIILESVRDSLEYLGKNEKPSFHAALDRLEKTPSRFAVRIKIHIFIMFPETFSEEIEELVKDKENYDNTAIYHEYYCLLKNVFANLSSDVQENYLNWVAVEDECSQYCRLEPIKDVLPEAWIQKYQEFLEKFGVLSHPDFTSYISPAYLGPISPISKNELDQLTPKEIIDYCLEFEPNEYDILSGSSTGLGEELKKLVSEQTDEYGNLAHVLFENNSRTIYIYHLLGGFEDASNSNKAFNWDPVLIFCENIISKEQYDVIYDDPPWAEVYGQIADLLHSGMGHDNSGMLIKYREQIWLLIKSLLGLIDSLGAEIEKQDNFDMITIAYNTFEGKKFITFLQYAYWSQSFDEAQPGEKCFSPNIKEIIETFMDPKIKNASLYRAIFGKFLPLLFYLDRDWTEEHLPVLFPEEPEFDHLWNASWSGYIKYAGIYLDVYPMLEANYIRALKAMEKRIDKLTKISDVEQRWINHVKILYLTEDEDESVAHSLLALFFQTATQVFHADLLRILPLEWEMYNKEETEAKKAKILARLKSIWELRFAEANKGTIEEYSNEIVQFGWWFVYSPLDKEWLIDQLESVLNFTNGYIELKDEIIKTLLGYFIEFPLKTAHCFRSIVFSKQNFLSYALWKDQSKDLLKKMKPSEIPEVIDIADQIIDFFGKKGLPDFKDI